jgi:hypothetical protein
LWKQYEVGAEKVGGGGGKRKKGGRGKREEKENVLRSE